MCELARPEADARYVLPSSAEGAMIVRRDEAFSAI
jgi:hypothetical protein